MAQYLYSLFGMTGVRFSVWQYPWGPKFKHATMKRLHHALYAEGVSWAWYLRNALPFLWSAATFWLLSKHWITQDGEMVSTFWLIGSQNVRIARAIAPSWRCSPPPQMTFKCIQSWPTSPHKTRRKGVWILTYLTYYSCSTFYKIRWR